MRNPFGIYEVLEVCAAGLRPPEDVYNVQASTALWLKHSKKYPFLLKSHSRSSLRFAPALHVFQMRPARGVRPIGSIPPILLCSSSEKVTADPESPRIFFERLIMIVVSKNYEAYEIKNKTTGLRFTHSHFRNRTRSQLAGWVHRICRRQRHIWSDCDGLRP